MHGSREGGQDPLKNHKVIRLLSNTGPDPLENHKAKNWAIIGPSAKHALLAEFGYSLPMYGCLSKSSPPMTVNVLNISDQCLFVLMFYVPFNNFSDMMGHFPVFLG